MFDFVAFFPLTLFPYNRLLRVAGISLSASSFAFLLLPSPFSKQGIHREQLDMLWRCRGQAPNSFTRVKSQKFEAEQVVNPLPGPEMLSARCSLKDISVRPLKYAFTAAHIKARCLGPGLLDLEGSVPVMTAVFAVML